MKDPAVYLKHILHCIERIQEDTAGGFKVFSYSELHQDAVLRNLQVLAESTKRLPSKLKETHPEIPRQSVAGFRNILVHDYLGIDRETIWKIISEDVPVLSSAVKTMLTALEGK